jgi:putative ABC transport system permease protein
VVGAGLQNSARTQVSDQLRADHVAAATGFGTIPAEVGETLADTPGVETVSGIRRDSALVAGSTREVSGVDPATIGAVYEFRWSAGDVTALDVLDRGGALISRSFADERNLTVGSALPITTPTGRQLRATVAGVFDAPRLASILGPVVIGQSDFDGAFPRAADIFALVATADGTDADALAAAVRPFPGVEVTSAEQFAESAAESLSTILNLLYVLLALSVLVSVFGMVNTMILSVHERTREIGMLRAVGMTRRQVRRMVRGESIVTALIGAALGLPIGLAIAALVTRALSQWDVALTIPVGTLLVFAGVAILVGVVAAVAPAARAGRLKVLDALHYE